MAISDEITRLQQAKSALKTSIEGKGVTVSSDTTLDDYPALVDSIETGGGGENMIKFIEIDLTGKSTSSSNPYIIDVTDKDVIYSIRNDSEDKECFSFNIEGTLSQVLSIRQNMALYWRYGGAVIRKYAYAGRI